MMTPSALWRCRPSGGAHLAPGPAAHKLADGVMVSPCAWFRIGCGILVRPAQPLAQDGGSRGVEYLARSADSGGDFADRFRGLTADLPGVAVLGEQQVDAFSRCPCVWPGDVGISERAGGA